MLPLALILNVLDTFLTLHIAAAGGTEANTLMAALLEYGAAPFILYKLLIVSPLLFFLHNNRENPIARAGFYFSTTCYFCCVLYSILGIIIWKI